jgi:hypothetical protein
MKNDPFPTDADIVKRLREIVAEPQKWCSTDADYVDDAADAIERLTAERDEARRLYCVRCSGSRAMEREIALKRGWVDLFPEGHGK